MKHFSVCVGLFLLLYSGVNFSNFQFALHEAFMHTFAAASYVIL